MSEHQDLRHLLDRAEHAAMAGDFASADELLRDAARFQEEELGPLHPDLANTLNNLAVVVERTGNSSEAEALYRRAAAIAAAALPSDHPMVLASRQNLEDFCRARGLPIDGPAISTPTRNTTLQEDIIASQPLSEVTQPPAADRAANTGLTAKAAIPPSVAPRPDPAAAAPIPSRPLPPAAASGRTHWRGWLAAGLVVLAAAAFFLVRPSSSPDASRAGPAQPIEAPPPAIDAPSPRPGPIGGAGPATAAPHADDRPVTTNKPPATGVTTVATAQVCRSFSTSGGRWRCDPVGDSVTPGPLVLYTRIRSPRDTAVVHRWYRGDTLQKSKSLTIRANATEGFRTYSRQTVDNGDWRVEVRSANGTVLHEQRFAVR